MMGIRKGTWAEVTWHPEEEKCLIGLSFHASIFTFKELNKRQQNSQKDSSFLSGCVDLEELKSLLQMCSSICSLEKAVRDRSRPEEGQRGRTTCSACSSQSWARSATQAGRRGALLRPSLELFSDLSSPMEDGGPAASPWCAGPPESLPPLVSIPETARPWTIVRASLQSQSSFPELQTQTGPRWAVEAMGRGPHILRPAWNISWILLSGFLVLRGITDVWCAVRPVSSHVPPICLFICSPQSLHIIMCRERVLVPVFRDQDEWGEVPPTRNSVFTKFRIIRESFKKHRLWAPTQENWIRSSVAGALTLLFFTK